MLASTNVNVKADSGVPIAASAAAEITSPTAYPATEPEVTIAVGATCKSPTATVNVKSAPPTASAPSFSAQSQDVCATGVSVGIQTFGTGFSGGKTTRDMNCERIKLAKVLYDFGMKVGSVALLCQDERVFEAMINAGTPCPVDGKIGKDALAIWNKYDHERPDYETYVKRIKKREKIDKKLNKQEAKTLELHTK